MARIGIVGAGIAGLSAARALVDDGHEVVVFERADQPGGRIATRFVQNVELPRIGTIDLAFDHGAQYFTVRDPRFARIVEGWLRDRLIAKWAARIVAFDHEGWEEIEGVHDRYVAVPAMSALGHHLASRLDVRYGARVTAIQKADHRWRVSVQDRSNAAEFDRVILAVPPVHAAALALNTAFAGQLASIRTKPCWTVLTAFQESVTSRFDAAFVSGSPLGWIARNASKPKRDRLAEAWVLQATTDWSAAHATDRSDAVAPFLLGAFADLIRSGLPKPFFVAAHRWREAVADPPLSVGALHDDELGLTICGDWCTGSRIEDAFLSGLQAASSC